MRIKGLGHPHSQTEGGDFIAGFLLMWDVLLKQRAVLWDGSNAGHLLSLAIHSKHFCIFDIQF